ncbi:hypothetical protein ABTD52_18155, partial [Acinetobacter baumannii]
MHDLLVIGAGWFTLFCVFIGLPWLVFHYITKWKQ